MDSLNIKVDDMKKQLSIKALTEIDSLLEKNTGNGYKRGLKL